MTFKNREGSNLNRRKIKIISQTPTEIIADIERADNVTEEGTKINAEMFNNFEAQINTASTNSTEALDKANIAITNSYKAVEDSTNAKVTAESVSNSFNELRISSEIMNQNYSTTTADWANSAVNTLPTTLTWHRPISPTGMYLGKLYSTKSTPSGGISPPIK